jgi:hypothetical protein
VVDLTSKFQTKRKKKNEGKGGGDTGEDLTNRWGAWEDREKGKTLTRRERGRAEALQEQLFLDIYH